METVEKEKALSIVVSAISQMMNLLMKCKDKKKSKLLKEKITVLQDVKDEIYKGNEKIIKKVIETGDINIWVIFKKDVILMMTR